MTRLRAFGLPLLPLAYAALLFLLGKPRLDLLGVGVGAALLGFWSARSQRLLREASPALMTALGYDAMRYLTPALVHSERVAACGLRQAELTFFSAGPNLTWGEFIANHHTPALDLFFAVPYTVFIYVAAATAIYWYRRDIAQMRRYVLAFAVANFLAFAFWLAIPAAPPWYVHAHGCAVDLQAHANPAGLARVDTLLGIHYFENFYGRAASVFGAMPSMHCAYPMIGLLVAFPTASLRAKLLHGAYTLWMFVAALYLDHHWVVDALVGYLVAFSAVWLANAYLTRREPELSPTPQLERT
ncbi:MAG: phosphatase PAP2 family protein [Myxococcota bacterium]